MNTRVPNAALGWTFRLAGDLMVHRLGFGATAAPHEHIAFIPWYPLLVGKVAQGGGALAGLAGRRGATPTQIALAWLLARSPVMLPIPGTSRRAHL